MKAFMRRVTAGFKARARTTGTLHPYIFQNHAFEEEDIFAGYGTENHERLRRVRDRVDPGFVFSTLQPGYHKLC